MDLLLPDLSKLPLNIQNMIKEMARDPLSTSAEIDKLIEDAMKLLSKEDAEN